MAESLFLVLALWCWCVPPAIAWLIRSRALRGRTVVWQPNTTNKRASKLEIHILLQMVRAGVSFSNQTWKNHCKKVSPEYHRTLGGNNTKPTIRFMGMRLISPFLAENSALSSSCLLVALSPHVGLSRAQSVPSNYWVEGGPFCLPMIATSHLPLGLAP